MIKNSPILILLINSESLDGITGVKIKRLNLRNAGGECVRFRYFVSHSELSYSTIYNCGVYDFQFPSENKNGEGIYIGTSHNQWGDGKNPTDDPDQSNDNKIHHNLINTQGNECVEIKEGASGNQVYDNVCTGNLDANAAGFKSAGNYNSFKSNTVFGNVGSGFLFSSSLEGYGLHNTAINNDVTSNNRFGFKIMANPQALLCENTIKYNREGEYYSKDKIGYALTQTCY